jgi:hypothetical protein
MKCSAVCHFVKKKRSLYGCVNLDRDAYFQSIWPGLSTCLDMSGCSWMLLIFVGRCFWNWTSTKLALCMTGGWLPSAHCMWWVSGWVLLLVYASSFSSCCARLALRLYGSVELLYSRLMRSWGGSLKPNIFCVQLFLSATDPVIRHVQHVCWCFV